MTLRTNASENRFLVQGNVAASEKTDRERLLIGILALPCDVEDRTIMRNGTILLCQVLTYSLTEDQLTENLPETAEFWDGDERTDGDGKSFSAAVFTQQDGLFISGTLVDFCRREADGVIL